MRFLVDAQLPPALARLLTDEGHDAKHITDIVAGSTSDNEVWRLATTTRSVLITKDEDFVDMRMRIPDGPAIVWVRIGNTSRRALLAWFTPLIDNIILAVESDNPVIELR